LKKYKFLKTQIQMHQMNWKIKAFLIMKLQIYSKL